MKFSITIFFLMLSSLAFAQNPRTENVGDFTEVKVFDLIRVNLIKAEENKVTLTGKDVADIELINKNGTLKIRMNLDKVFDGQQTFVQVYYKDLRTIDGNEGAQIVSNELIEQQHLEIRMQEGASIKAGLDLEKLDARAVTGGILDLTGKVDKQKIELNTGGIFNGKDLHSQTTNLRIQAGGEADIYATDLAEIKVRAGGDARVFGNPKQVVKDKFIGGNIKMMN